MATSDSIVPSLNTFDITFGETITRLLAREDLVVEFDNVETAYFFPKDRKVVLPTQYVSLNKDLLSLMSAHEVSHALHTPDRFFEDTKEYGFAVLMILEDARIENRIKEEFPGLVYTFKTAYETLLEKDFFGILKMSQEDINALSFLDKINLKAKAGDLVSVEFDEEESDFFSRLNEIREYEDLLLLAQEYLDKFSKNNNKENDAISIMDTSGLYSEEKSEEVKGISQKNPSNRSDEDSNGGSEDSGEDSNGGSEGSENSENKDESSAESKEKESGEGGPGASVKKPSLGSSTPPKEGSTLDAENKFRQNLSSPLEKSNDGKASITTIPDAKFIERYVVPYKEVLDSRFKITRRNMTQSKIGSLKKIIDLVHKQAKIMTMEFEQKKSAFRNSRSKVSDTGIIDTNRLSKYRTSDEIFKKMKVLPNAKNHGMIIFVDYSGSMTRIMPNVIKQLLIFTEFCRKVQIPFEVYAFSNRSFEKYTRTFYNDLNEGRIQEGHSYRVQINLFSSKMSDNEYKRAFEQMAVMATEYSLHGDSGFDRLGGTPLQETVIDSFGLTEKFLNENPRVQKMNTLYLTDGEGTNVQLEKNLRVKNKIYTTGGRNLEQYYFSEDLDTIGPQEFLREVYEKHFGIQMSNVFLMQDTKDTQFICERCYNMDQNTYKKLHKDGVLQISGSDKKNKKNKKTEKELLLDKLLYGNTYSSLAQGAKEWSNLFLVLVNRSLLNQSTNTLSGESLEELSESFSEGGVGRLRFNSISRKLAAFVS